MSWLLFCYCNKIPWRGSLRKRGFTLTYSSKVRQSWWGSHGAIWWHEFEAAGHISLWPGSRGRWKLALGNPSPFYSVWDLAYNIIPSTFRVSLPTSGNLTKQLPCCHAHRLLSQMVLDLAKLTISTNHHGLYLAFRNTLSAHERGVWKQGEGLVIGLRASMELALITWGAPFDKRSAN